MGIPYYYLVQLIASLKISVLMNHAIMKITLIAIQCLLILGLQSCGTAAKEANEPTSTTEASESKNAPIYKAEEVLFWSQDQRDERFDNMQLLAPAATVIGSKKVRDLPAGKPLNIQLAMDQKKMSIEAFMAAQNNMGIVVVQDGKMRLEAYNDNRTKGTRWISFSVTKSITSTLVGAAIADGLIKSIDDPITQYIPELKGSGYDGTPIRHVLTMSSGVQWNEDYTDPNSDVAQMSNLDLKTGEDPTIAYMKTLKRTSEPGKKWNYNTGETNLIGVLVSKATGKTLSEYLSEKIWIPFGMESKAYWMLNSGVSEYGGCCLLTTTRDFARFGLFVLDEMNGRHKPILPKNWFAEAGGKQIPFGNGNGGYGYQWWVYEDGSFAASGIFGQGIFIDPARNLVIAINSNYVAAVDRKSFDDRDLFYQAVQAAIDAED